MRKIQKKPRNNIFTIILIPILAACSNNESQTKQQASILSTENVWVEKSIDKGATDNLSPPRIPLEHQGKNVQTMMSCEHKSVHLKFTLTNAQFTTTVVYVPEETKWVKGTHLAFHKENEIERPKRLAIQRLTEENVYDINLPVSMLIKEGKLKSIEAQLSNGEKLVISFNELALSFIDKCIKKIN